MKLSEKKKSVAGKMRMISDFTGDVGESRGWKDRRANFKASENKTFGKSLVRHFKKNQKGRESLNPPHKGRDNEVMEGKNERENN